MGSANSMLSIVLQRKQETTLSLPLSYRVCVVICWQNNDTGLDTYLWATDSWMIIETCVCVCMCVCVCVCVCVWGGGGGGGGLSSSPVPVADGQRAHSLVFCFMRIYELWPCVLFDGCQCSVARENHSLMRSLMWHKMNINRTTHIKIPLLSGIFTQRGSNCMSINYTYLNLPQRYHCTSEYWWSHRNVDKLSMCHAVGFDHGLPCRVKNMARGTQ